MSIQINKLNVTLAQLNCDGQQLNFIRQHVTTKDPKARFNPYADDVCPISAFGNFAVPLTIEMARLIRRLYPGEPVEIDPELLPICLPTLKDCAISEPLNNKFKLRPYQVRASEEFLKYGRGLIVIPTRGGKSMILYTVFNAVFGNPNKNFKTALLVVPNTQLVTQMYDDFIAHGMMSNAYAIKFSSKDPTLKLDKDKKIIIISNRQWLQEHLDELPGKIDMLFVDEVQGCGGGCDMFISRLVRMCRTNHKLGCTATLGNNEKDIWNVKKLFGPVTYEIPFKEVEEGGYISSLDIKPIKIIFKQKPILRSSDVENIEDIEIMRDEFGNAITARTTDEEKEKENPYIIECNFLAECNEFNDVIRKLIESVNFGNRVVMFDRITHGKRLFDMINYDKKYYIDGQTPINKRDAIKAEMSENKRIILCANAACLGVGITIKSVSDIFMINIRSASVSTLQQIGRGLMREENKEATRIWDIYTPSLIYSKKHHKERLLLYRDYYKIDIRNLIVRSIRI